MQTDIDGHDSLYGDAGNHELIGDPDYDTFYQQDYSAPPGTARPRSKRFAVISWYSGR